MMQPEDRKAAVQVLENDVLKVTVADAGAELTSVRDKESGAERIWTGDAAVWNRHAPILFPFVGRVTEGKYRFDGKEYTMRTQHGFARDRVFLCTEKAVDSVTHVLTATDDSREIYPFDFRLTVRHSLNAERPRQLDIRWIVENLGNGRMYYAIGGHPGFLMPEGVRKEDCYIHFPGCRELRYISADAAGFALPEQPHVLNPEQGYVRYRGDIPDTWIFEDHQVKVVGIAGPDRRVLVTMDCSDFPMLAVWANRKGPFICLEPWFGRTDNAGFAGALEEKKEIQFLDAGGKRETGYSIVFEG